MSTTVELGKATAEIARLRAGIDALAEDLWNSGCDRSTYYALQRLLAGDES